MRWDDVGGTHRASRSSGTVLGRGGPHRASAPLTARACRSSGVSFAEAFRPRTTACELRRFLPMLGVYAMLPLERKRKHRSDAVRGPVTISLDKMLAVAYSERHGSRTAQATHSGEGG